MQNIDSDLIRGNIDTIILKTMLNEDKYGLDIIKEVSDKSSGTYELKQPTLYSCLKRLENQGLLSSYFVDSEIGGKRHYYKLTDKGRDFYNKKQEEWAKSKFIIDNLLSNYNYEEYRLVKKDEYDQILQDKANAPVAQPAQNDFEESAEEDLTPEEETKTNYSNDSEIENDEIVEDVESGTEFSSQDDFSSDYENGNSTDFEDETLEDNFDENNTEVDNVEDIFEFSNESQDETQDSSDETIDDPCTEDDDYPVYFKPTNSQVDETEENKNTVSYETTDQSANEMNFLSRLHAQDDEEINTYYGDKKSYVNHLNSLDDSQLEQQNLLDDSLFVNPTTVDDSINAFSTAINNLKTLNNSDAEDETEEDEDEFSTGETQSANFETNNFTDSFDTETYEPNQNNNFDDLQELNTLNQPQRPTFFNSFDNAEYDNNIRQNEYEYSNQNSFDSELTDSSDASYENEFENEEIQNHSSFSEISNEIAPTNLQSQEYNNSFENSEKQENLSDIDSIIQNNISLSYQSPEPKFRPQSNSNYREKLSNLSMYSKVSLDEKKSAPDNTEALEKAKNISEITKELEEEGIKIKEHYKSTSSKNLEKNYLLSNKINLMKSFIMFFGYVFILSAIYIVLNNTNMKNQSWFNIKYFLYGFIPFAAILLYQIISFAVNPYKKIPAKYHARIMFFISIIITVQLLLITYCVNLQFGFYSFTQKEYNHLMWIIPTIISFAPIIDNIVYYALYKSKNFNV